MQTAQHFQQFTNCNKHLSGFDLTTLLIRGGLRNLGLNSNAKQVLLYLATCYNERNGVVYPRVKTIAEAMDISERGVIRALQELTEKGCIIRSKRKKNSNEYVITKKVLQSSDVITDVHNDTSSSDTVSSLMNEVKQHEVKKQQTTCTNVQPEPKNSNVVVSLYSFSKKHKAVTLAEVPDIIKQNKNIKNPCAYWASLSEEQKNEYLQKQRNREEVRRKTEELKCAEAEAKAREEAQLREELNKPLNERFTKQQAIKHVWQLRNIHKGNIKAGLTKDLIELYNLDVLAICQMSETELKQIS